MDPGYNFDQSVYSQNYNETDQETDIEDFTNRFKDSLDVLTSIKEISNMREQVGEVKHSYNINPVFKSGLKAKNIKLPSMDSNTHKISHHKTSGMDNAKNFSKTQSSIFFKKDKSSFYGGDADNDSRYNESKVIKDKYYNDYKIKKLSKGHSTGSFQGFEPICKLKYNKIERGIDKLKTEREAVEALWEEPKHRNAYLRNMHKTVTSLNKHNLLKDVERQVFERDELRKLHSDNINLTEKRNTFEDMLSNQHKRTAGIGETDDAIFDRIDYIKKYTEMQSSIKEIITEDNVDNFEHFLKSVI